MSSEENEERNPLLRGFAVPETSGISPIVREDDHAITIRRPVQYYTINTPSESHSEDTRAVINRYKYYGRLDPHRKSSLVMPNHVVPPEYFLILPFHPAAGNQSSIVTIFSIWNTMVGTSILSMPWAVERAGFGMGLGLILLMGAITLYTAYRVINSPKEAGFETSPSTGIEFSDICRHYLGRCGEYISIVFSLTTLLGAAIVYWVLMTNFLYNAVAFIYDEVNNDFNSTVQPVNNNYTYDDVYCHNPPHIRPSPNGSSLAEVMSDVSKASGTTSKSLFDLIWIQDRTVPVFLILVLGPLINFKSPTFFTKFNALGTVSVLTILLLVAIKGAQWGVHMNFDPSSFFYIPEFQWTFPALSGILSLAMFIHNCILSIVRNQRCPQNNGRDLSIAYVLVTVTYIFVGVIFYVCFPLPKSCIEDNLLNNFEKSDVLAFTARLFLFFQMVTVFPLLMYIFRIQFFNAVYNKEYPGLGRVVALNGALIGIAVIFAVFLPKIGVIISFSGALCGLVYVFTLPCLVYMLSLKAKGSLTWPIILIHSVIIVLGVLNFAGQFTYTFL